MCCVSVYMCSTTVYKCINVCECTVCKSLFSSLCIHNSTSIEHDNEYFIVLQNLALINDSIILYHTNTPYTTATFIVLLGDLLQA